ncbi:hypothetical protein PR003_g4977 [Phytophthora rubi]|uniref:Uncharacterized protein n=1 Tax=Phytophthora rubi TaxID=129364 RepID=A0A6A4FKU1_9STRA|nr:hypothetical protein PR003_g4977 [Phytophthora rubi]
MYQVGSVNFHSIFDAKMASWQFLQPWALALNRVLVHLEQLSDESAKTLVEIECFPENFDYTGFGFPKTVIQESYVLLLAIPADAATRGDRQHLQRVREAIDLFQVLALVNSAAFADLIFDFYDGVSGPNCVIRLEWRLFLIGSIAPDDPAATKPTLQSVVSWRATTRNQPDNAIARKLRNMAL